MLVAGMVSVAVSAHAAISCRVTARLAEAAMTGEILSYSRGKGLFAGIDLSGGVLRPDVDSNKDVYGTRATPRTILASREISAPTEAHGFLSALNAHAPASSAERPAVRG